MTTDHAGLALTGGTPVRSTGWPAWPVFRDSTAKALIDAGQSGRWAISGPWTGAVPFEQQFAEAFAAYLDLPWCVATDHGSSALVMALEALGVGAGDEVIVPALTWIAPATAVLRVNAIPVFVDVDPTTGCISPDAVAAAITPRTAAIVAVHLHYLMADMDRLTELVAARGLALIEDCAQAHGAVWSGRKAGSIGDVGAFSMQQSKALTCGEGGAVVTGKAEVYRTLQQLRADSRTYAEDRPREGEPYLQSCNEIMGTNYCLSEFHAAVLLEQLAELDAQVAHRDANTRYLLGELAAVKGVSPLRWPEQLDRSSVYELAVERTPDGFAGRPTDVVCAAIGAELGMSVYQTDAPAHLNPMYCPGTNPRWRAMDLPALPGAGGFPAAEGLQESLIVFHHAALLADRVSMQDVVAAFAKVAAHADDLPTTL